MTRASLIERGFACELSQWRNLARIVVGWQVVEFNFLAHDILLCLVCRPLLVTWCIQDDERENVNVPHSVHASEESWWKFQVDLVVPLPLRFGDLTENKADDSQESAEKRSQHEKLEAVNNSLVVESTHFTHGRQYAALYANIVENLPHHETEKEEVNGGWDGAQHNECHLSKETM